MVSKKKYIRNIASYNTDLPLENKILPKISQAVIRNTQNRNNDV